MQDINLDNCASPLPPDPRLAELLDTYRDKLGVLSDSSDITGLLWNPVPLRFAVR